MPLIPAILIAATLVTTDTITVRVRARGSDTPVAQAQVMVYPANGSTRRHLMPGRYTDSGGTVALALALPARIRASRIGYTPVDTIVTELATHGTIEITLAASGHILETVTVGAIRGASGTPVAATTLSRDEIRETYAGQEMPLLLQSLPSVTATSDAGSASGYTYFRLRGLDQTRVNITLDGIPLNEPEDQGFYFANLPDLASDLQSVQVQRGVGTSSNGTAPWAGAVSLETLPLASLEAGGELQLGAGSYDTRRASISARSGQLGSGFAAYGRLTSQRTDGFRVGGWNRSTSAFASGGYVGARHALKAMAIAGDARNGMAYLAADAETLKRDRRANPLFPAPGDQRPEEDDRFRQALGSIAHSVALAPSLLLTTTVYHNRLRGGYDVWFDPDMLNFNVSSRWTGALSAARWTGELLSLDAGIHSYGYSREHWLLAPPSVEGRLYTNSGHKSELSGFLKGSATVGRATLFADVGARTTRFRYVHDVAGSPRPPIRWSFVNPRAGATVRLGEGWTSYASIGRTSREPTRNDMFGGFDNLDASNDAFVGALDRVRPERVTDAEAGITHGGASALLRLNAYAMEFHDEITPIGKLSYIGLPLRKNVDASHRRGIELEARAQPLQWLRATAQGTLSSGRIERYTDDESGVTYHDVEPLLSPRVQGSAAVTGTREGIGELTISTRHVGRSFLANTGDARFTAPAYTVADVAATLGTDRRNLLVQLENVADARAFPGGYTDGVTSYYYVLAGRRLSVTARWGF